MKGVNAIKSNVCSIVHRDLLAHVRGSSVLSSAIEIQNPVPARARTVLLVLVPWGIAVALAQEKDVWS